MRVRFTAPPVTADEGDEVLKCVRLSAVKISSPISRIL